MSSKWKITSLNEENEQEFMLSIRKNKLLHIFTFCDVKNARGKTEIWIAMKNRRNGYLIQYDKKIVHTHGDAECLPRLFDRIDTAEAKFAIEPQHLAQLEKLYVPTEPSDATSPGNITTYLIMSTKPKDFRPSIAHEVRKISSYDLNQVFEDLGKEYRDKAEQALHSGIAFEVCEKQHWVSAAFVPEIIEHVGLIRGVYTTPAYRGKGFSTSTVSALVKELFRLRLQPGLWVAEDNVPARRVYEKIGFKPSTSTLLGFTAKKKSIFSRSFFMAIPQSLKLLRQLKNTSLTRRMARCLNQRSKK